MEYLKTTNVTNVKNVLVQLPAHVVQDMNLQVGDKLEVRYDTDKKEVCIKRAVY